MEKENKSLKVIIVILIVLLLGLTSYIIYDKALKQDANIGETNNGNVNENNNETNNSNNIENSVLENELKKVFDVVYNYYESVIAYCGEYENTDRLVDEGGNRYNVSTEFKTYDEMIEYLKHYMSEDVIAKKTRFSATNKEYYLEENGKLYCATFGKGGIYTYGDSSIKILTKETNKITAEAKKELTDPSGTIIYDKINITFEKNNNDWIITIYEKQKED